MAQQVAALGRAVFALICCLLLLTACAESPSEEDGVSARHGVSDADAAETSPKLSGIAPPPKPDTPDPADALVTIVFCGLSTGYYDPCPT